MRRTSAARAVLALAAGCGGGDEPGDSATASSPTTTEPSPTRGPYGYDAAAPVRLRDLGRVNSKSKLQVRDVVFAGADGHAVSGYLLTPPGKVRSRGRVPPRLGRLACGLRRDRELARRPAARWRSRSTRRSSARSRGDGDGCLRQERDLAVRGVIDTRRAVDALRSLPQVDDDRIGLVGFSAGARSAAIVAGVEPRLSTVVLWSGGSEPVGAYTTGSRRRSGSGGLASRTSTRSAGSRGRRRRSCSRTGAPTRSSRVRRSTGSTARRRSRRRSAGTRPGTSSTRRRTPTISTGSRRSCGSTGPACPGSTPTPPRAGEPPGLAGLERLEDPAGDDHAVHLVGPS